MGSAAYHCPCRARAGLGPKAASTLAALVAAIAMLAAATGARAALPIQQFQSSYSAYNPWTAWETWLSQPQCTEKETIYGAQPAGGGPYPVLIYLHSTLADWSGNQEGQVIVQLAAEQGFVALAPTYDSSSTNNDAGKNGHAACMFGPSHPNNVVSYACSLAEADCSNGVLVAGFSQGGSIALRAKNYDPQVTAAWVMGANGLPIDTQNEAAPAGTRALPDNKLRIDLGELDVTPGGTGAPNVTGLAALTGDNCGGIYDCLQSDGSGYYIVSNAEVADHSADHCYWMAVSKIWYGCTLHPTIAGLDPGFAPPSTLTWSMITNLNWLAGQL